MRLYWAPVALVLVLLLHTKPVHGQTSAPDWAFGEPAAEAIVGAVALSSIAAFAFPQRESAWAPYSARQRHLAYGRISDFSGAGIGTAWQLAGGYALEAVHYETFDVAHPYRRALRSSLIDAESALLAAGLTAAIKRATGRCRPRAWRGEPGQGHCAGGEYDAFPSGHVAPVAAIAGSRFAIAVRTTGPAGHRFAAFGLSEGAAVLTAFMRVLAGAHSWEDVTVGWILGHATGVAVSLLHPMQQVPADGLQPIVLKWGGNLP